MINLLSIDDENTILQMYSHAGGTEAVKCL